ncbi:hypothetical protein ACL36S_16240 [Lactiplantibacillus plantarum]
MAFEDKMNQLKKSMNSSSLTNEEPAPRISKSYTLKQNILTNELAMRAKEKELTASKIFGTVVEKRI